MDLNLPSAEPLLDCRNLLIAGMGGGFDIFCGLPVYFELRSRGQQVHLANFSFADVANFRGGVHLSDTLKGVTAGYKGIIPYFPELHLASWFRESRNEDVTIWCFHKTGARPLLRDYRTLTEHLSVDGILLVDGGVDSLIRGDEAGTGTLIEDAISLFAVNELKRIGPRQLACIGFGAEQDIAYKHILENIANITAAGGFLGACSLTKQMKAYRAYEDAVLYVQGRKLQDPSVINSSIVSSVQGRYGNYHLTGKTKGSHLWISPLMSLYWFFDATVVARRNLYLPQLQDTDTFMEALHAYMTYGALIPRRPHAPLPLP